MKSFAAVLAALAVCAAASSARAQCQDNPGLDSLALSVVVPGSAEPLSLSYAGCSYAGQDDLEPAYETRSYSASGGWSLVLVTYLDGGAYGQHDPSRSEVLLARGTRWVARFGDIPNAKLSGGALAITTALQAPESGPVSLVSRRACAPSAALDGTIHARVAAGGAALIDADFAPLGCERLGRSELRRYKGPGEQTLLIVADGDLLRASFPFESVSGEAGLKSAAPGARVDLGRVSAYTRDPRGPRYTVQLSFGK